MNFFVEDMVTQVLSVYNYSPRFKEDWSLGITKLASPSTITDKFKIKSTGTNHSILTIEFVAKHDGDIYLINAKLNIDRKKDCLKHADFLGLNCIKVIKTLLYSYSTKAINFSMIISILEKTIEESIIAIMIGNKQTTALADPLVNRTSILIRNLSSWSNRTYEGRKIPFSFLIDTQYSGQSKELFDKINSFLKDDASALLTDGITSYISISNKIEYKIIDYYDPESISSKIPLVPYRFSSFATACTGSTLGIVLTVQGDILFIKKTRLIFAKRNGLWHYYDYDAFNSSLFHDIDGLGNDSERKTKIKKIYISCLDTAFARTGGCLAICLPQNISKIKGNIRREDIHKPFVRIKKTDESKKRFMLEDIVIDKKTFYNMGRKALQEIMGIDGATIILTDGSFITTGAIIDNKTKKEDDDYHGGARTKITRKLSEYGIAIKISADGYIECYKNNIHIF